MENHKDVLQQAEEILHVIHHPDATVYVVETVQPPIVDSSPTGPTHVVPPVRPVLLLVIVALVLPLASLSFQLFLLAHPFTATILVQAQQVTRLAHIYQFASQFASHATTTPDRHYNRPQAYRSNTRAWGCYVLQWSTTTANNCSRRIIDRE